MHPQNRPFLGLRDHHFYLFLKTCQRKFSIFRQPSIRLGFCPKFQITSDLRLQLFDQKTRFFKNRKNPKNGQILHCGKSILTGRTSNSKNPTRFFRFWKNTKMSKNMSAHLQKIPKKAPSREHYLRISGSISVQTPSGEASKSSDLKILPKNGQNVDTTPSEHFFGPWKKWFFHEKTPKIFFRRKNFFNRRRGNLEKTRKNREKTRKFQFWKIPENSWDPFFKSEKQLALTLHSSTIPKNAKPGSVFLKTGFLKIVFLALLERHHFRFFQKRKISFEANR